MRPLNLFSPAAAITAVSFAFLPCFSQTAVSAEQRIVGLEQRIKDLENRLVLVENRLNLAAAKPKSPTELTLPLKIRLFQKKFVAAASATDEDKIGLLLELKNNDTREIVLLQGTMTVRDLGGSELIVFEAAIGERIPANAVRTWFGGITYNDNDAKLKKLRYIADQEITVSMKVTKVGYSDGTVNEAGK
jgi:hypothetical protein